MDLYTTCWKKGKTFLRALMEYDSHPSTLNNVKNPFFFWGTPTKILKIIFGALDRKGAVDKWEDKITENFKIGLKSRDGNLR